MGVPDRPAVPRHGGHVGEEQEPRRAEAAGEELGREVLVDHRLAAAQPPVRPAQHGDTAAAGADRQDALGEERLDRLQLDDLERVRRGDDAAEPLTVARDRPAVLLGERAGARLRVDGADRLRGRREGGIVGGDDDLREDGRDRPAGERVAEGLLDQVSDPALALGPEHVERGRRHLVVGVRLEREQPHLRAVPVREHELAAPGDSAKRAHGPFDVLALGLRRRWLAAAQQRVAAERDDEARTAPHQTRSGSPVMSS